MIKQKILVSALIAGGLMSPLAHATNGYLPIGYGMKNEGMGGVGIALPQDSIAAAVNPAGMVMVGDRADIGLTWFKPTRSSTISGNGFGMNGTYDGNGKSNFFIPQLGYNKMINADTSVGVSVFGNGGMNTQYNVNPFAAFGSTGPAGINLEQLFIAPAWSMKLNPSNSVGIALNLAYQRFSATGLQAFDNPAFSSNPGAVTNNGNDSSTGYGLRLGWTGEVSPTVTLGVTYQTKTKMGKLTKYSGLFADGGRFDIPSNFGAGIAVKATPATTVGFDVERINYGEIPSVGTPFTSVPPGFGGTGARLGAANGPGFGWQNMTVFKLGVSYAYDSSLTLRAGYNHNDQQIPATQTLLNILAPGVVQDHLSLGATWKLTNQSEITLAYVHAFKKTVNGAGSIPPQLGGGNANINMYEDSIGVTYGW